MKFVFDIETNGLLDVLNTIHCIFLKFQDGNQMFIGAVGSWYWQGNYVTSYLINH